MKGLPGGKGLFAFSDQAGANACMALANNLISKGKEQPVLVSNQARYRNNIFNLDVLFEENIPDFKNLNVDYVFTGTSHPESSKQFEIKIIEAAKKQSIYSIAFVDHWVNFRIRFLIGDILIESDEIWVLNNEAKFLAIAEGLSENKIRIHSNPYHEFLKLWKPKYQGKCYLEERLKLSLNAVSIILYAPDPLSTRSNKNFSFNEITILESILKVLSKLSEKQFILIVKPHPLQDEQPLKQKLNQFLIKSFFLTEVDNHELINASDIVIGMYSNFLIEAACLNKPVVRFFPGPVQTDLLRFTNTGILIKTEKELLMILKNI